VRQFLQKAPVQLLGQLAYAQSAIASFADINVAIALLGVVCIPLIFLLRRRKLAGPVHIEIEAG
jgi:hypothetical protein